MNSTQLDNASKVTDNVAGLLKKMEPREVLGLHDELLRPGGIVSLVKELELQTSLVSKFHEPFWAPCKAPKLHMR